MSDIASGNCHHVGGAPGATRAGHDADYAALLRSVRHTFDVAAVSGEPLFTTDVAPQSLYAAYLDNLPSERQVHTCNACRRFVEAYGGLARVNAGGRTESALWEPLGAPTFYHPALQAMRKLVEGAPVTGVYLSASPVWGVPQTGPWSHLAVDQPPGRRHQPHRHGMMTADQVAAALRENYHTVARALGSYRPEALDEVLRILKSGSVSRSERFVAPVEWLRALHDRPPGRVGAALLWRAVATAPDGYCHPRASVLGSMLDDLVAGLSFTEIKRRFDEKMDPLKYQRPQAPPAVGNVKAAEEMFAKMGLAPALERRYARLDEVVTAWRPEPTTAASPADGIFSRVRTKATTRSPSPGVRLPTVTSTWVKFAATVLQGAERLELFAPQHGRYIALVTAASPDAPPIIRWDREDARNPVTWYVYPRGSYARDWGLTGGEWVGVTAVVPLPTMWGPAPAPHLGEGVVLVLPCVDTLSAGSALFPEFLRDDLRPVRATIEAYSRTAKMGGRAAASACGYDVRNAKGQAACRLRALTSSGWTEYEIDRWD